MNEHELRAALAYVKACLLAIHNDFEGRALDDDAQARWDEGKAFVAETEATLSRYDEARALAEAGSTEPGYQPPAFNVKRDDTPFDVLEDRSIAGRDRVKALVDGNLRAVEDYDHEPDNLEHFERSLKRHAARHPEWAANLLARQRPEYISGFAKLMLGQAVLITNEERTALSVGSNTNGGFLLPTHIDPTVILTSDGSANTLRQIARIEQLTAPGATSWNSVTSAGVTASFDAELAEVSDDSPTFARPNVPVHMARAFVQGSIESIEDISGLAGEVLMLFADAKDVLEGEMYNTGSGTNQPTGIWTALDANTNVEITSTTAATIGLVDLHSVYRQVPQRFRRRAAWLMNPQWALAIKELGTAVSASFSGDLRDGTASAILNKAVYEDDDCPNTVTTTALDLRVVCGDFRNFLIVDKPGSMAVEFIPHLFNTTTNLPDGRRGWFAHWRTGSDSINDVAFRLLLDKTSA